MANINVVPLNSTRKQSRTRKAPRVRRATKSLRRQAYIAAGIGMVALVVTGLSLHHLAAGIRAITGAAEWEGWCMAVAIDIGFVFVKLSTLVANEHVRRQIGTLANITIIGTLAGSAGMNIYAFAVQASNPYALAAAVALGLGIPALIFAFMRVGAALWFDCQNRTV
jgi:hypothetical protein